MLFFVFVKQNTLQLEGFQRPITHELNTGEAIRKEEKNCKYFRGEVALPLQRNDTIIFLLALLKGKNYSQIFFTNK